MRVIRRLGAAQIVDVIDLDEKHKDIDDAEATQVPDSEKRTWTFDPRMFGDQCCVAILRNETRFKRLEVRNGRFPGTDLKARFYITLQTASRLDWFWNVTIRLNGINLDRQGKPLENWMRGAPLRHRLDSLTTDGFGFLRRGFADRLEDLGLFIRKGLILSLDAHWRFVLEAEEVQDAIPNSIRLNAIGANYWSNKLTGELVVATPLDEGEANLDPASRCPDWARAELDAATGIVLADLSTPIPGDQTGADLSADVMQVMAPNKQDSFRVDQDEPILQASIVAYHVNSPAQPPATAGRECRWDIVTKRPKAIIHCLSGIGSARGILQRGANVWLDAVRLEKWSAIEVRRPKGAEQEFLGQISAAVFPIAITNGRLLAKALPGLDASTLSLKIRANGENQFKCCLAQICADIALEGADYAHIDFGTRGDDGKLVTPVLMILPDWIDADRARADELGELTFAELTCDADQIWRSRMDLGCLRTLRADMNLDLTFRYRSVMLTLGQGSPPPALAAVDDQATMVVELPPQHLAERALDKKDETAPICDPNDCDSPDDRPRKIAADIDVLESRLANRSRVAFNIPKTIPDTEIPDGSQVPFSLVFSLVGLTNWPQLEPAVNARALPQTAGLEKQLKTIEFTPTSDAQTNRRKLRDAARDAIKMPGPFETAIELPYRVILSPSSNARWTTSRIDMLPSEEPIPLWSADINTKRGDPSFRAIWSPDVIPEVLSDAGGGRPKPPTRNSSPPWLKLGPNERPSAPEQADHEFLMSTTAFNRHEMVLVSSVFGLPALMGISVDVDEAALKDPNKPYQPKPKDNSNKDASVVPSPKEIPLFKDPNPKRLVFEGLYVPRAITPRALGLTSFGGYLDSEGSWEPPAAHADLWPALNLERWRHQAILGRDTYVEIVSKGFLFPIGLRASYIEITERKFHTHPKYGFPIAVLIKRRYIQVSRPEKTYKALNQRHDGRGWPVKSLKMVTLTTPDLVRPEKGPNYGGRRTTIGLTSGNAFWPKTQAGKGYEGLFPFKVRFDDDDQELELPLMFVDNTATHSPKELYKIVKHYNDEISSNSQFRNLKVPTIRRQYADSTRAGDTEFPTYNWRLKAAGRTVPLEIQDLEVKENPTSADISKIQEFAYSMDSVMESADQPPFYPFVEEARIQAQSIKAMTGSATGIIDVQFHELFIRYGFDTAKPTKLGGSKNPSEVFLRVVRNAPSLNFSQNGGASGGIAKPNSKVVGLSRSHGLVGGKTVPAPNSDPKSVTLYRSSLAASRTRTTAKATVDSDLGNFNPLEAFTDAKFLGLDLADLLSAALFATGAPQMVEQFLYDVSPQIPDLIRRLQRELKHFTNTLDKNLKGEIPGVSGATANWRTLYPKLSERLVSLDAALSEAIAPFEQVPRPSPEALTKDPKIQAAIGKIVNEVKSLLDELKRLSRNPIPGVVSDTIRRIRNTAAVAKDLPRAIFQEAVSLLVTMAKDAKKAALNDLEMELKTLENELRLVLNGEVKNILTLLDNARNGLEEAITEEANAKFMDYYEKSSSQLKGSLDYAFAALLGRPVGIKRTINLAAEGDPPIYETVRVYEPFFLKDFDNRPDVGALRDSLYDNFVAEPLLRLYNDLKELERLKQDALNQLVETLLNAVKTATQIHELHSISAMIELEIAEYCEQAIGPIAMTFMRRASQVSSKLTTLDKHLAQIHTEFKKPKHQKFLQKYSARHGGPAHDALVELMQRLPQSRQRVSELLTQLFKIQEQVGSTCEDFVKKGPTADLSEAINKLMKLRRDALRELELLLTSMVNAHFEINSLSSRLPAISTLNVAATNDMRLIKDLWKDVKTDVAFTHKSVADLIKEITSVDRLSDVKALATKTGAFVKGTTATINRYKVRLKRFETIDTDSEFKALVDTAIEKLAQTQQAQMLEGSIRDAILEVQNYNDLVEREFVSLIMEGTVLAKSLRNESLNEVLKFVQPTALSLYAVHVFADYGLQLLSKEIGDIGDEINQFKLILRNEVFKQLDTLSNLPASQDYQDLKNDLTTIKTIAANLKPKSKEELDDLEGQLPDDWKVGLEKAQELQDRWESGSVGLVTVGEGLIDMVESLVTGDINELLDLNQFKSRIIDRLEDELEKAILDLIPTSLSLSYDWGTTLRPFPDSNPLFLMNKNSDFWESQKVFKEKKNKKNHFLIDVKGAVDVISGERDLAVRSYLRPFSIKLFPGFDALTINFKGAYFEGGAGGSDFDIKVEDVIIGPALAYIKRLAEMLSPDTGPYLDFTFSPPTVIAGFRLNLGTINLGGVAFINIALDVACLLPLDNRRALFQFGLSNRSKPFLISAPPYGGGGFVSIQMEAADLVGFTAGFEMGAVVDISFGPLTGHGRVTSGVYVDKQAGRSIYITGFVQAYGECSIACFGVCAALGVSLTMVDSDMWGDAWYSFSFKIGFFKAKFEINVQYTLKGGENSPGSGPSALSVLNNSQSRQIDTITVDGIRFYVSYKSPNMDQADLERVCRSESIEEGDKAIVACVHDRSDWKNYRDLFV